jgi:hypothetical protein
MGLRGRSWAPDRSATAQVCDTPATVVCEVAGMSPFRPPAPKGALAGPRPSLEHPCRPPQPTKGLDRPTPGLALALDDLIADEMPTNRRAGRTCRQAS